jgi:hypothetical protein
LFSLDKGSLYCRAMPSLRTFRTFLAVARHGTSAVADKEIGLTGSSTQGGIPHIALVTEWARKENGSGRYDLTH